MIKRLFYIALFLAGLAGLGGLVTWNYYEARYAAEQANKRWVDRISDMVASECHSLEQWVGGFSVKTATFRNIAESRPGVAAIYLDNLRTHEIQSWERDSVKGHLRPFGPWLVVLELKTLETDQPRTRPLVFIQGQPYSTVMRPVGNQRVLLVFLKADNLLTLLKQETGSWHLHTSVFDYEKNPIYSSDSAAFPPGVLESIFQRVSVGVHDGTVLLPKPKLWLGLTTFHYDPASDWIYIITRHNFWVYAPLMLILISLLGLILLIRIPYVAAAKVRQEALAKDLASFAFQMQAYIQGQDALMKDPPSRYKMLGPIVQSARWLKGEWKKAEAFPSELALERRLLGLLVESLPEGILFFNEKGSLQLSNELGRVFLALEQDGRESKMMNGVQIPRGFLEPFLEPVFTGQQPNNGKEVDVVWADGKHLYRIWVERVEAESQKSAGYIVIVRDITFRKQWEYVQEQVLSGITHDLRGPLSAVLGYMDLMKRHLKDTGTPKVLEYLGRESAVRLSQMVNDLLDVVRFEQGKIDLSPEETPVVDMFQRLKNTFGGQAEQKKVVLKFGVKDGENLMTWADRKMLERVLDNLLGNALKFTPAQGLITVSAKQDADRVIFEVADTGRGIPREAQSRIFDKFQQVSPGDRSAGYGLGLAVAKFIVEAHQGEIRVESEIGVGSRFTFWVPTKSRSTLQPAPPVLETPDRVTFGPDSQAA